PKGNGSEVVVVFCRPHSSKAIAEEYILQLHVARRSSIVGARNHHLHLAISITATAQVWHPDFKRPIICEVIGRYRLQEVPIGVKEEQIKILCDARHRTNRIVNYQAVVTTRTDSRLADYRRCGGERMDADLVGARDLRKEDNGFIDTRILIKNGVSIRIDDGNNRIEILAWVLRRSVLGDDIGMPGCQRSGYGKRSLGIT